MLPLVQRNRHAVPSHNFDSLVTRHDHDDSLPVHQQRRAASSPYHGALPFRTSRSQQRIAVSSILRSPPEIENHLRRKTPNGTIDAGYDGSHTQLSLGSRPLKHMIMPAPTSLSPASPSANPAHYVYPSRNGLAMEYQLAEGRERAHLGTPSFFTSSSMSSFTIPNGSLDISTPCQPWQLPYHVSSTRMATLDHLPLTTAEYDAHTLFPHPTPTSESLPLNHTIWQHNSEARNSNLHKRPDASFSLNHVYITSPIQEPCSLPQYEHSFGPASSHEPLTRPLIDLQALSLKPNLNHEATNPDQNQQAQPHFRERVLNQAYSAYNDLLGNIQASRKANHMKTTSGFDILSKSFVYPKPPKPKNANPKDMRQGNLNDFQRKPAELEMVSTQDLSTSHTILTRGALQRNDVDFRAAHSGLPAWFDSVATGNFQTPPSKSHVLPYLPASLNASTLTVNPSPTVVAKSSLSVLKNLCEQSNWQWVDGLLLGGCLSYGLERFSDALIWFSRVVALDSSHVEAITNMAATLYCLGRLYEAEQHWLEAIRLQPQHLEAAEHLVGLLYKKRSQEAVNIIAYVQKALRLSETGPARQVNLDQSDASLSGLSFSEGIANFNDSQTSQPNILSFASSVYDSPSHNTDISYYGSSGYALSGSENGRILALVHAKGTMLYSLKDTRGACEAFEEAVLIGTGRRINTLFELVCRIQTVLTGEVALASNVRGQSFLSSLLLSPDRARQTAHLVFANGGELPGLSCVPHGAGKRAAIQTTSNSLLSLAKIFQDTMSSGNTDSNLAGRPPGIGDILALYYLSLSLQESPSTANNVGILLAGMQQVISANPFGTMAVLSPQSPLPGITPGSGLALALAYYNYGLRLDPKHVHLHTNLGSLLKDIGQLDLAIEMYERAVACDGTFDIALTNLANAVKDRGRINDAIAYYKRAVRSNPGFAEAVCGLLTALNSVCDWRGRGGVILESGKYDRWHVNEHGALVDAQISRRGCGLTQRVADVVSQQLKEASYWGRNSIQPLVVHTLTGQLEDYCDDPHFDLAKGLGSWVGRPWEGSRLIRLIERATRVILRRRYRDLYETETNVSDSRYLRPRLPSSLIIPSAPTVLPFHTFTCPLNAKDIRIISQRNALRISCSTMRSPWLPATVYPPPRPPNPHLNIGYLSSDFNNHPLAHLMQSVFGLHNSKRARAICYATTASDGSVHRQQIENEAPVFRDVSSWSSDKLIEQIVHDQIHILVNLNGYTRGARNEIFAARPAPIQMSFMGFAGSLGAEWCDYILADATAIPHDTLRPWRRNVSIEDVFYDDNESDQPGWMYSENIIFCPDTFFCCDHAQSSDEVKYKLTWEEDINRRWAMRKELFPYIADDTIILANFNQLYKIEPTTFRSWLRILTRAPKALLWLLRFPELGEHNLRRTAEAWAGPEVASRLIFTDVAPKSQHISRARVCDLFLDTPECNAHTTAADVLWSSTPLLTFPRYPYKMCSRIAASILKGALPKSAEGQRVAGELIVESEADYEEMATELARGLTYTTTSTGYSQGIGRLAEMREILWKNKWQCGLFDTRRWVDNLERAYDEAWRRWVVGEGGDIYL